jgi:hypothetical protein
MIQFFPLCLGIGLILAGITLVWAGCACRERMREPELVLGSGGLAILIGILFILIVVFWRWPAGSIRKSNPCLRPLVSV